jgi:hypothetical protein
MSISEIAACSIVELHYTNLSRFNAGELESLADKVLSCRHVLRLAGVDTLTADGVTMTLDEAADQAIERLNAALGESVSLKLTFVKKAKFEQDWFGNTGVTVTLHRD